MSSNLVINCGDPSAVVKFLISEGRFHCLVNKQDVCMLSVLNWHWDGRYVKCRLSGKRSTINSIRYREPAKVIYMHRLILGVHGITDEESHVDHLDGNGANNTRNNIAIVGRKVNNQRAVVYRDTRVRPLHEQQAGD